jgi:hypothetical protein
MLFHQSAKIFGSIKFHPFSLLVLISEGQSEKKGVLQLFEGRKKG